MNKKDEHTARKYADIKTDFDRMDKEQKMRMGAIYDELSKKYYLEPDRIFRIISKQTKFQQNNCEADGEP